ncbi:hypothetical protein Hanom_Chr00s000031g01617141 [Helianthus anomalus]
MIKGKGVSSDDVIPRVSRSCKSVIYEDPPQDGTSVIPLSTYTLMETLPPDRVQCCRLVYERRRRGHRHVNLVDGQEVGAVPVDEGNVDDLIVDPHPGVWHCTPLQR